MYYVAINNQPTGPLPVAMLSELLSQGQFSRDTLVWWQGQSAWVRAHEAEELRFLFGAVPPPLPKKK